VKVGQIFVLFYSFFICEFEKYFETWQKSNFKQQNFKFNIVFTLDSSTVTKLDQNCIGNLVKKIAEQDKILVFNP